MDLELKAVDAFDIDFQSDYDAEDINPGPRYFGFELV